MPKNLALKLGRLVVRMRIWSKKLIPVLPTKQLKAMRYELGDMIKQYPNIKHPLVKFANNYDIAYLGQYYGCVLLEFNERNINRKETYDEGIICFVAMVTQMQPQEIMDNDLKFKEDNIRYLIQCYYNLQEKYDRGIITQEEWNKIESLIGNEVEK